MKIIYDPILQKFRVKDSGGSGTGIFAVVANYSALPSAASAANKFYWVSNPQGTAWLLGFLGGTYYPNGIYYSNGVSWEYIATPYQATQSEVNTGTNDDKFVTPLTFTNASKWATKEDSITASGNVTDFWSGIKTFRNLATDVRAIVLTGLSLATSQVVAATDTILQAIGYLQAQITAIRPVGFGGSWTGFGGIVAIGSKGTVTIPYGFVITNFYIHGNVSGSCVMDLRVGGVSIVGAGNKPTLTGAQDANAAVSGWTTTTFAANTQIEWYLESCSTIQQIDITIKTTKSI